MSINLTVSLSDFLDEPSAIFEGTDTAAWLCLARHRHARFACRGLYLCGGDRKAPGLKDCLPGGYRLPQGLDYSRTIARGGRANGKKPVWPLSFEDY